MNHNRKARFKARRDKGNASQKEEVSDASLNSGSENDSYNGPQSSSPQSLLPACDASQTKTGSSAHHTSNGDKFFMSNSEDDRSSSSGVGPRLLRSTKKPAIIKSFLEHRNRKYMDTRRLYDEQLIMQGRLLELREMMKEQLRVNAVYHKRENKLTKENTELKGYVMKLKGKLQSSCEIKKGQRAKVACLKGDQDNNNTEQSLLKSLKSYQKEVSRLTKTVREFQGKIWTNKYCNEISPELFLGRGRGYGKQFALKCSSDREQARNLSMKPKMSKSESYKFDASVRELRDENLKLRVQLDDHAFTYKEESAEKDETITSLNDLLEVYERKFNELKTKEEKLGKFIQSRNFSLPNTKKENSELSSDSFFTRKECQELPIEGKMEYTNSSLEKTMSSYSADRKSFEVDEHTEEREVKETLATPELENETLENEEVNKSTMAFGDCGDSATEIDGQGSEQKKTETLFGQFYSKFILGQPSKVFTEDDQPQRRLNFFVSRKENQGNKSEFVIRPLKDSTEIPSPESKGKEIEREASMIVNTVKETAASLKSDATKECLQNNLNEINVKQFKEAEGMTNIDFAKFIDGRKTADEFQEEIMKRSPENNFYTVDESDSGKGGLLSEEKGNLDSVSSNLIISDPLIDDKHFKLMEIKEYLENYLSDEDSIMISSATKNEMTESGKKNVIGRMVKGKGINQTKRVTMRRGDQGIQLHINKSTVNTAMPFVGTIPTSAYSSTLSNDCKTGKYSLLEKKINAEDNWNYHSNGVDDESNRSDEELPSEKVELLQVNSQKENKEIKTPEDDSDDNDRSEKFLNLMEKEESLTGPEEEDEGKEVSGNVCFGKGRGGKVVRFLMPNKKTCETINEAEEDLNHAADLSMGMGNIFFL